MDYFHNFSIDLVITYLINFAYVLLRAITYAVSCFAAVYLLEKMIGVGLIKDVRDNKNMAAALVIASIFFGLSYIIGQI
ncbi:MAG: DUF350 domain-containing protein [Fibrobacterota bacterium]